MQSSIRQNNIAQQHVLLVSLFAGVSKNKFLKGKKYLKTNFVTAVSAQFREGGDDERRQKGNCI
jgi:hypothetical protein